ncbi:hypothetical protein GCM10009801_80240 [Streptomyces albiaxialis]|uniref:Peptidase inhibitor n=1 Tax=Streptomyces albiaxialis TaxID=329523 RepID=A0ABN2X4K9_9ACTN
MRLKPLKPHYRRLRNRLALPGLATTAVLATLPLAAPSAASAAPVPESARSASAPLAARCANGAVCTWTKAHFQGNKSTYRRPHGCYPWNGRTVSNQRNKRITLYKDHGCWGSNFDLRPHTYSEKTPWKVRSIAVWG